MATTSKEIFPQPFVQLAWARLRFDSNLPSTQHGPLIAALGDAGLTVALGAELDVDGPPLVEAVRDADLVAIYDDAIVVLTADYGQWERFGSLATKLFEVAHAERGVREVALGYLDEIRPPTHTAADEWSAYLKLPIGAGDLDIGNVGGAFGGLVLCGKDDFHITIEWTHTKESAINEGHPLEEFYDPPADSILALEWNASWQAGSDAATLEEANSRLNEQQAVIKTTFTKILTEKSVKLMRGEA